MSPKISVIIPVYNVDKYLKQCLESIINQTLKDIELIIVDDGSTDNSKEVIEYYKSKYCNIKTLYQKNQGVSVARNLALKHANGEYVFYMDSDDFLENNCLELLYDRAKKTDSEIVIFSHKEIYDDTISGKDREAILGVNEEKIYDGLTVSDMVLNCRFLGTPWNKLFKRQNLIDNNFTYEPGRYVQDWYPIFVQIYNSDKIVFVNKALYNYRIRGTATTSKKTRKNIDDYNHAATNIIKYANGKDLNKNSILKFNAIILNTVIGRYYTLPDINRKNMYASFKRTDYYNNKMKSLEVLKIKDLSFRTKLNIVSWNMKSYHILMNLEGILRGIKK